MDVLLDHGQCRPFNATVLGGLEVKILHLEIPAGPQIFEGFAKDILWRLETGCASTAVDVIEGMGEEPLVFGIVDLELTVLRYAALKSVGTQYDGLDRVVWAWLDLLIWLDG